MTEPRPPVIGFAAYSGTGKTTLLEQLLPLLRERGLRIGVIKHAHHHFDIDHPGKDSHRLRQAGAQQMLIASRRRRALITETPDAATDPDLDELLAALDLTRLELVLVEGFRHVPFAKIELHRPSLGHPLLAATDTSIIAIATDAPFARNTAQPVRELPRLDLNRPAAIAAFILARFVSWAPAP